MPLQCSKNLGSNFAKELKQIKYQQNWNIYNGNSEDDKGSIHSLDNCSNKKLKKGVSKI